MSEIPDQIRQLIDRCEVGEDSFGNDDMSLALKFGELLWRRLTKMSEHYDRSSGQFVEGDNRAPVMRVAAKDMRHVLDDTRKDFAVECTCAKPSYESDPGCPVHRPFK